MGSRHTAIAVGVVIAVAIGAALYARERAEEQRLTALELRYADALSRARGVIVDFAGAVPTPAPALEDLDCGGLPPGPMFLAHVARIRWIAAGGRFGDDTGVPTWLDSVPFRFLGGAYSPSRSETSLSAAIAGVEAIASAESLAVLYTRHAEGAHAVDAAAFEGGGVDGTIVIVRISDGEVICHVAVASQPTFAFALAQGSAEGDAWAMDQALASSSESSFWREATAAAARAAVTLRRE